MSVKNFSPVLLDIFKMASEKPFTFDCGSVEKAHAFRSRLHRLRREMRKEKHWLTPVAEKVIISLEGSKIIAHPPDIDIEKGLEKALRDQGFKQEKIA